MREGESGVEGGDLDLRLSYFAFTSSPVYDGPMKDSAHNGQSIDWLQPTWTRGLFAAALAAAGFFLPQEVPLEWYPLNNPGTDINYLEIACAADKAGEVQIYYDTTRGTNELESIRWPISPTVQTYTYTFPLPDAPIVSLRLNPVARGGTLHIRQMQIINRRGDEIRRFSRASFYPNNQIAAIAAQTDGWAVTTTPEASDPFTMIDVGAPVIPAGMNGRNLQRCLLSTGYLALMLWILLLAVLLTFYRPARWRELPVRLGFMAAIALLFAAVGNRGLIRNSIHHARFVPPALNTGANAKS